MFDDSEQRFTVDRTRSERRPFHRLPLALDKELHLPVDKDPTDQISLVFGPVVTERIEQKVIDIDHPAIRVGPILLYVGILPHRMFAIELENIAVHIEQQNIVCDLELSLEFSAIAVFNLHLLFPFRFQYVVDIGGDFMQNLLQTAENGKSIVKNLLIQMSLTAQLIDNGVFETTRVTVHNFSNVILGIGNRISTIPVIQFVLHQPDLLALGHRRLCIPAVDLAQVLQPDAVHLRNAVQRLARFSHMNHLPVRTAFALGPDIKHIAGLHRRIRLQIVVTGQLLDRHPCFRCDALRSVTVLNYDEQAAVIPVYGMFAVLSQDGDRIVVDIDHIRRRRNFHRLTLHLISDRLFLRKILPLVQQIQLFVLDNSDQQIRIPWICRITGLLKPFGPTPIIGGIEFEQGLITFRLIQEFGMVVIRGLHRRVFPETLVRSIIRMCDGLAPPVAFTLDSEMVIPLTGQTAVAVVRLKQRLSQFDAGRNPVKIHLLNRQRFIFIDVFGPRHSLLAIQSRNHHPDQDEHRYEFHHSFHHEQSIIYFGQK